MYCEGPLFCWQSACDSSRCFDPKRKLAHTWEMVESQEPVERRAAAFDLLDAELRAEAADAVRAALGDLRAVAGGE